MNSRLMDQGAIAEEREVCQEEESPRHDDMPEPDTTEVTAASFAILSRALNAVAGNAMNVMAGDERRISAVGLLVKFYAHASSAFHLSHGTRHPIDSRMRLDTVSVFVLCRAAFEAFLRFYHIFVDPKTPEAQECMYLGWKWSSLLRQQKYPTTQAESREVRDEHRMLIEEIEEKLASNQHYGALGKQEASKLRRDGMTVGWSKIAASSGLSDLHADHYYSYLCGQAHSGWLDVRQLASSGDREARASISGALETIVIAMAFMIDAFTRVFPTSRHVLSNEQAELVRAWRDLGAERQACGHASDAG